MQRVVTLLIGWALITLVVCSCGDDRRLASAVPTGTIAVGAFLPITVVDACRGGGRFNFDCTTQTVVELLDVTAEPSGVAEILTHIWQPAEIQAFDWPWALRGVRPGDVTVMGSALLDDGTTQPFEIPLSVASVSRIELDWSCGADTDRQRDLLPLNHELSLEVLLQGANGVLNGVHPSALTGTGLRLVARNGTTWYRFTPSESPRQVLQSRVGARASSFAFNVYEHAAMEVHTLSLPDRPLAAGQVIALEVDVRVAGKRPCRELPFEGRTLTPEICGGGTMEVWSSGGAGFRIVPLRTGVCRLAVGAPGGLTSTFDISLEL